MTILCGVVLCGVGLFLLSVSVIHILLSCYNYFSVSVTTIVCFLLQNLHHPGVVNLEKMFETPEKVSLSLTERFSLILSQNTCFHSKLKLRYPPNLNYKYEMYKATGTFLRAAGLDMEEGGS